MNSNKQRRGWCIAFEGIDRTGKSTQAASLVNQLNEAGYSAELWTFPDRSTPIGSILDSYIRDSSTTPIDKTCLRLLFSANRWEVQKKLEETLQRGVTVVIDRYAFSGVAYAMASDPSLSYRQCMVTEIGLIHPDIVIYLDASVDTIKDRPGFGRDRFETIEFQTRASLAYCNMVRHAHWTSIDARGTPDDVRDQCTVAVFSNIERDPGHITYIGADIQQNP